MVLGNSLTMIAKILVCLVATLLGLYGAWWVSSLAHAIFLETVSSFDDLTTIMLTWFAVTAAVLCPVLCWGALQALKRVSRRPNA